MPETRPTESIETLRCNFTDDEKLTMGRELAEAHNNLADLDENEKVVKAQMKEARAVKEARVNCLARELAGGFTMRPVKCRLVYDDPNPNEVSTYRTDTEELVKTRPFTVTERQADLPLETPATEPVVAGAIDGEQSATNIVEFFNKAGEAAGETAAVDTRSDEEPADEAEPIEADPLGIVESEPAVDPEVARQNARRTEAAQVQAAKENLAKM